MAYTLLDAAYAMYYPEAEFAAPLGGKKSRKGIRLGKAVRYGALAAGGLGALQGAVGGGMAGREMAGTKGAIGGSLAGGAVGGGFGALSGAASAALGYGAYRGVKALGRKIRRSKKRKYK